MGNFSPFKFFLDHSGFRNSKIRFFCAFARVAFPPAGSLGLRIFLEENLWRKLDRQMDDILVRTLP